MPGDLRAANQPLFTDNRGDLSGPNWPLTDEDVDVRVCWPFPTSSGSAAPPRRRPVPAIFSGPHANVHNNFEPGDMADLQFSPRDPVFYSHHANIDRLWSSWVAAGHSNPDFGNARVMFYDETRTWRFVLLNDLRDETKLGYKYSTLMQPAKAPRSLTTVRMNKQNNDFILPSAAATRLRAAPAEPAFLLITNLQNLERMPDTVREFGIFTKPVASGVQATPESGYVGKVTRVFSKQHAHAGPLSASVNITGKVSDLRRHDGVYVADDGSGSTAAGIPLVADAVS